MNAVQLSFEAAGLDPHELAELPILSRAKLYDDLGLNDHQREAFQITPHPLPTLPPPRDTAWAMSQEYV
jgi:hypothetical protein